MAMNRIQFHPGLSMREFVKDLGTQAQYEQAPEVARWSDGFRGPRCQRRLATSCATAPASRLRAWAKDYHLARSSVVFSDGLACFGAVTEAGCSHHPTVIAAASRRRSPSCAGSTPPPQTQDQPVGLPPSVRLPEVWRSLPRGLLPSLQPVLRSEVAASAPAHRRRLHRSAAAAVHAHRRGVTWIRLVLLAGAPRKQRRD